MTIQRMIFAGLLDAGGNTDRPPKSVIRVVEPKTKSAALSSETIPIGSNKGSFEMQTMPSGELGQDFALAKARAAADIRLRFGEARDCDVQRMKALRNDCSDAILLRAGNQVEGSSERARSFADMSLCEVAAYYYQSLGVANAMQLSRAATVELLDQHRFRREHTKLVALAQSVGDFTNVLGDALNKGFSSRYLDSPPDWPFWCSRSTAPDFKDIVRVALSEVPGLSQTNEGGEVNYVPLGDSGEVYALGEYRGGVTVTRRAFVNDDLDAFGRSLQLLASAAARLEDDTAYGVLTTNPDMADGNALFSSAHANVATGAAPSVAALASMERLLMNQKGPQGAARLGLRLRFLLVPTSIFRTAQQAVSSTIDPTKTNDEASERFSERMVVIPSARLDNISQTAYYGVTASSTVRTVEVCFLFGEETPVLSQKTDFNTDDVKFRVRHVVAAKAVDFRGLVKNPGA